MRRIFKVLLYIIGIVMLISLSISFETGNIVEGRDFTFNSPQLLDNNKKSQYIYGKIKENDDVDFIKFKGTKGDEFFIQLTSLNINSNKDFKPNIAIISNKIYQSDNVPFSLPKGHGAIVIAGGENLTNESDYKMDKKIISSLRGEIPSDGEYYISVYSTNGKGKYILSLGEEESSNLKGSLNFIENIKLKFFVSPFSVINKLLVFLILFTVGVLLYKKRKCIISNINKVVKKIYNE